MFAEEYLKAHKMRNEVGKKCPLNAKQIKWVRTLKPTFLKNKENQDVFRHQNNTALQFYLVGQNVSPSQTC